MYTNYLHSSHSHYIFNHKITNIRILAVKEGSQKAEILE